MCVCVCVSALLGEKSQKEQEQKQKISQTNLTDWEHNLTANANITFTDIAVLSPAGTDSQ